MGQRFHFDLKNGEDLIRDDEGVDASGPVEAIEEARAVLAEMRRQDETPLTKDGWQLVIRDEEGATLTALPLGDNTSH